MWISLLIETNSFLPMFMAVFPVCLTPCPWFPISFLHTAIPGKLASRKMEIRWAISYWVFYGPDRTPLRDMELTLEYSYSFFPMIYSSHWSHCGCLTPPYPIHHQLVVLNCKILRNTTYYFSSEYSFMGYLFWKKKPSGKIPNRPNTTNSCT